MAVKAKSDTKAAELNRLKVELREAEEAIRYWSDRLTPAYPS